MNNKNLTWFVSNLIEFIGLILHEVILICNNLDVTILKYNFSLLMIVVQLEVINTSTKEKSKYVQIENI